MTDKRIDIMGYPYPKGTKASKHDVYKHVPEIWVTKWLKDAPIDFNPGDLIRDGDCGKRCQVGGLPYGDHVTISTPKLLTRRMRPSELKDAWDKGDLIPGEIASIAVSAVEVGMVSKDNPTANQALHEVPGAFMEYVKFMEKEGRGGEL